MTFQEWWQKATSPGRTMRGQREAFHRVTWDAAKASSSAQIERLRTESAAFEQAWKDACARAEKTAEELAPLKALLREAGATAEYAAHQLEKARIWGGMDWHYNPLHPLHYRSAIERLRDMLPRIRAALGDEPADDATRKQP